MIIDYIVFNKISSREARREIVRGELDDEISKKGRRKKGFMTPERKKKLRVGDIT